jgi:hypothetical protein
MLRADYCGDGGGHTRNGTHIDIVDRLGFMSEFSKKLSFEAAWAPDGASCVAHIRVPNGPWTLESVEAECPKKLRGRTGKKCTETRALARPKVLMFNRS